MKQYNYIPIVLAFMFAFTTNAQQKLEKASQSIKADKEAIINLNTNFTNIEIDTWNKDIVEIEAYVESSELTQEELQRVLDNWDVEIEGSGDNITIATHGSHESFDWDFNFANEFAFDALHDLQFEMADFPEIPEMPEMPEMPEVPEFNFEIPELPVMPEMPELPELPEGIENVRFDTEAYKKDGEKYLTEWSKQYEEKYGKEYKEKMKAWAKEFAKTDFEKYSKEMEAWGEKFGEKFGEQFGEKYAKDMEKWGEEYAKRLEEGDWAEKMEKWGEEYGERFGKEFEKRMEEREKRLEARQKELEKRHEVLAERQEERVREMEKRQEERVKRIHEAKSTKVIKTIKIKMPKKAKLKMNVRHGELKFASVIHNAKADLAYTTLIANSIDGRETSINASYSPVIITNWNLGELKLNFVESAQLKHVNKLILNSNSSNLILNELTGNATISGSFGDFEIGKIDTAFNNLTLVIENSDAKIYLPTNNDYNLQYQGNRSHLKHPGNKSKPTITSFSSGNSESNKTIVVNAKYSDVVLQ
ncbi:MAG: hypothetical protein P8X62_06940 [Flavobacteriaceae bacterium]